MRGLGMLSTVLDLLGIACLAVFAWFVWEPAPLLVVGVALILISYFRDGVSGGDEQ